jgi:hypothetical protein
MAGGETFNLAEEFAGVDFNDERLEKRFRRAMEMLAKRAAFSGADSAEPDGRGKRANTGGNTENGLQRLDTGKNPA